MIPALAGQRAASSPHCRAAPRSSTVAPASQCRSRRRSRRPPDRGRRAVAGSPLGIASAVAGRRDRGWPPAGRRRRILGAGGGSAPAAAGPDGGRRRSRAAPADHVLTARVHDVNRVHQRRVIPTAAHHAVDGTRLRSATRARRALAGVDAVVAVAADQHVTAALAEKPILAPSASQPVRAAVAGEHVVTAPTLHVLDIGHDVVALTGDAVVRPRADRHEHRGATLAVDHDVATRPSRHPIRPQAAAEDVVTRAAAHIVGAGATERPVITRTTVEPVRPRLALQKVTAGAAEQDIVPTLPAYPVRPTQTADHVTARRAAQAVRAAVAGHGAGLRRDGDRVDEHRRRRRRRRGDDEQRRGEAQERNPPGTTRPLPRRDGVSSHGTLGDPRTAHWSSQLH